MIITRPSSFNWMQNTAFDETDQGGYEVRRKGWKAMGTQCKSEEHWRDKTLYIVKQSTFISTQETVAY